MFISQFVLRLTVVNMLCALDFIAEKLSCKNVGAQRQALSITHLASFPSKFGLEDIKNYQTDDQLCDDDRVLLEDCKNFIKNRVGGPLHQYARHYLALILESGSGARNVLCRILDSGLEYDPTPCTTRTR